MKVALIPPGLAGEGGSILLSSSGNTTRWPGSGSRSPSADRLAAFDEHLVAMPVVGVDHGE